MQSYNRGKYAQDVLKRYQGRLRHLPHRLPPVGREPTKGGNHAPIKIGILGAGSAGLYAAMIIKKLEDPDVTYELLEAHPDRTGGRLFTYKFAGTKNDYYDVGAMRYPQIPFMDRTMRLFDILDIKADNKLLIEYIMSDKKNLNLNMYNEKVLTNDQVNQAGPDPFGTGQLPVSYTGMVAAKIEGFKQSLADDFQQGWNKLQELDKYSMRTYMSKVEPCYTDNQITTLETFESSSNLYDCALLEMVLDSMDFDWTEKDNKKQETWSCVQGGSSVISDRMTKLVNVEMGCSATSLEPNVDPDTHQWKSINVCINDAETRTYDHVINTMPFGCFRNMDTSKCHFDWELSMAIRGLHYDSSVKVAMKFKHRWWEQDKGQIGGVSSTDRPTRTVVYPSYGIGTDAATMIVSYTWAQDAARFGALCQGKDTPAEKRLIQLILKDLSDMHGYPDTSTLTDLLVDYHAWNWYGNEYSSGAFALFGPGQFENLYPHVTQPFGGLLHFAGEATSVHHAWLVGALNSAFRSVYEIFVHEGRLDLIEKIKVWGDDDEFHFGLLQHQVALGQHKGVATQKAARELSPSCVGDWSVLFRAE